MDGKDEIRNKNIRERYLNEIRPYITDEDDVTLNSYTANRCLNEILPKSSEKDFQLEIQLIHEINKMGCHVLFTYRIDSLEVEEIKRITPVLMKYVGQFESLSSNQALLLNMGRKGNYQATDFLIREFRKPNQYDREITDDMTEHEKSVLWNFTTRWAVSNALLQIRDKSRLDDYIEFAYNSDTRKDCFFIATLIGKFKCQKSYDCLIDLLSDENYELQTFALRALKGFHKYEGIEEHVRPFLNSEHKGLRENAGKIIKKIEANKG